MQVHCALLSCQRIHIFSVFCKFYWNASFSLLLFEKASYKYIFTLVLLVGLFFWILLEHIVRNFCIWRNTFIPVRHQLKIPWMLYRHVFKITHSSITLLFNVIIVLIRTLINYSNTKTTDSKKYYLSQFSFSFSLLYNW